MLRACEADLVAREAPRGTPGPDCVGMRLGDWARAFGSGRRRTTWSRAKLRGARQSLMASEGGSQRFFSTYVLILSLPPGRGGLFRCRTFLCGVFLQRVFRRGWFLPLAFRWRQLRFSGGLWPCPSLRVTCCRTRMSIRTSYEILSLRHKPCNGLC